MRRFNSLLEMLDRRVAMSVATSIHIGFNSLLEMQDGWFIPIAKGREITCFNSLLEMLEALNALKRGAVKGFNSLLEMLWRVPAEFLHGLHKAFQFSIGDAPTTDSCFCAPTGSFNSLLEMLATTGPWSGVPSKRACFNSLLEMQWYTSVVQTLIATGSFNSLLEMLIVLAGADKRLVELHVSILYWRCVILSHKSGSGTSLKSFQFSIGDAPSWCVYPLNV